LSSFRCMGDPASELIPGGDAKEKGWGELAARGSAGQSGLSPQVRLIEPNRNFAAL